MTDLTKITTPFALLDGETRKALKAHGGPYEYWSFNRAKWASASTCWDIGIIYRVAHEKDTISWDHVADEFICMARDANGICCLYTETPQMYHNRWDVEATRFFHANGIASYKPGTCDWKDSLVFRPGHEPKGEQNDD